MMTKKSLVLFSIIMASLAATGCSMGGRMNLKASNLKYPASTTSSIYDSNLKLLDEGDYEVVKPFSITKTKWTMFDTLIGLTSDPDISEELNSLIKENNGDAIVNLGFRANPPGSPISSLAMVPPLSLVFPSYFDVNIDGNIVRLDKDRITFEIHNRPIKTVAVLPVANDTADVEAPEKIRQALAERIVLKGYVVKPISDVNRVLKDEMGITLGRQLDMATAEELGKRLGVDAVIYGTLFDYEEKSTGVLNIRRVRAGFKLVDATTGKTIWGRGRGVKSEAKMGGNTGAMISEAASAVVKKLDEKERLELFKKDYRGIGVWNELPSESVFTGGQEGLTGVGIAMASTVAKKVVDTATASFLKKETEAMLSKILLTMPQANVD